MFLRNCWYVTAWARDIAAGSILGRQVIGEAIAIFRTETGSLHAVEDRCAHRHAPLSLGRVEGEHLRCMYHGLKFGTDGRCVEAPGANEPPPKCSIRVYPVVEQDSWIWVWMGDVPRADPCLIPKAFGLDKPRWTMRAGQMEYNANYQLINDNLCDLSHLDFVHKTTLGLATGYGWSDTLPSVTKIDRGLRIERWLLARPASVNNPQLVDTWSSYDYVAPGIFVMENRSYKHGTAERTGFKAPAETPMTHRVEQQAVTPISDARTHYFFATGFDAGALPQRLIDGLFDVVMQAFSEDRQIIEGQQKIWDVTSDNATMAFIPQDKAPAMMRRTISQMIKAECEAIA